jgi:hypothetical protein
VNLWKYRAADGQSIRTALDYLTPYLDGKQKWPHGNDENYPAEPAKLAVPLIHAARGLGPDPYRKSLEALPWSAWESLPDRLLRSVACAPALGNKRLSENRRAAAPAARVKVTLDTREAPELNDWALKAKKLVEHWYPIVSELLHSDGFTPPREVTLVFKKEMRHPTYASGTRITLSAAWFKGHPGAFGVLIHEMTHTIQQYRRRPPPRWLCEGIADYVRFFRYEPQTKITVNPRRASYSDGYGTSAAFLAWAEKAHDRHLVRKLNAALRQGKYRDELFKAYTGRTLDQLWASFLASLERQAPAPSAGGKPMPQEIPAGKGEIHLHLGEVKLKVFTYRPKDFDPEHGPMFWTFHGHARDPQHYRDAAEELARHSKGIVLAPLFDEKQFPGDKYFHGNVLAKGKALPESEWTFSLVPRMIEEVRKIENRPRMPHYLFGHSAGGQFVMRLMAFAKLEPIEAVAANPGSLLFPTTDLPYPYGFGQLPDSLGGTKRLKAFLAARLTLYSGTCDNDPNHPELDHRRNAEKQGPHRLARARNAFTLAKRVAKSEGGTFNWRLVEAPGVAHNGPKMLAHPQCRVALFDRPK